MFPDFFSSGEDALEDILAPLTNLHRKLGDFIQSSKEKHAAQLEIIREAADARERHARDIDKATQVQENFSQLLKGVTV